jgi:hypothetical protein
VVDLPLRFFSRDFDVDGDIDVKFDLSLPGNCEIVQDDAHGLPPDRCGE